MNIDEATQKSTSLVTVEVDEYSTKVKFKEKYN